MELNQLLQFKTIVDTGNMSRAAQTLFISQPALSQNLSKLEKELGVQLFDHKGNKLVLNETGQKVLRHVNNVFEEINKIKLITDKNTLASDTLRLSSYEDPSLRYFGATISGSFPGITLVTALRPDAEIIQDLKNGQTDIAFSAAPIIDRDIFTTYLCESVMSVSAPPDHELFPRTFLTWEDLNNQSFLIPAGFSYLFDKIAYVEKEKNIQIKRLVQRDFGLYRVMINKSPFLYFSASLDHFYAKDPTRKEIPVVDPTVTIRYYASCKSSQTSALLPYITCIQRYYWAFEKYMELPEK